MGIGEVGVVIFAAVLIAVVVVGYIRATRKDT